MPEVSGKPDWDARFLAALLDSTLDTLMKYLLPVFSYVKEELTLSLFNALDCVDFSIRVFLVLKLFLRGGTRHTIGVLCSSNPKIIYAFALKLQ